MAAHKWWEVFYILGKEHNFNTYSYSTVDERRVPYDYSSVMHYGDTSFS